MSKRYIILAILLIGSAFGLLMIPHNETDIKVNPEEFLVEINDPARFLDTDQIAKRMETTS